MGGPRVARVDQYFSLLLGQAYKPNPNSNLFTTDPDRISGTLGALRDELGLWSINAPTTPPFPANNAPLINTVEDEQNVTNYRLAVDYITSLAVSWINNQQFFGLTSQTPFFGTQLVVLSRQLSVVADTVNEVRFTMDSVFITPSDRQTLQINFPPTVVLPANPRRTQQTTDTTVSSDGLFMEDVLTWIQNFACEEATSLIQEGGKFAVSNSVLPMAVRLRNLVLGTMQAANAGDLPDGFNTARVQRSLGDLSRQLDELAYIASPLTYTIPSQK